MTLPDLYADNVPVSNLLGSIIAKWRDSQERKRDHFWSTQPRTLTDPTREIMELTLSKQCLVNYLGFQTAHFPHDVTAEYKTDDTAEWQPFLSPRSMTSRWWEKVPADQRVNYLQGLPVSFTVADSVPARVNVHSAVAHDHPQHYGPKHWSNVSWRTQPVLVTAIRLILVRNPYGLPPIDANQPSASAAYSLGVRNMQVGYRINTYGDMPQFGDLTSGEDAFSTSIDALGSRVAYTLAQDRASSILDDDDTTLWRSNPQPVNYAVVNLYVDTRAKNGIAPVIDRFYLEPLTVGPHLNLYWSNDEPSGDWVALDEAVPTTSFGTPASVLKFPQERFAQSIDYSGTVLSGDLIDNAFLQLDLSKPWWFGLRVNTIADRTGMVGAVTADRDWLTITGVAHAMTIGQVGTNIVADLTENPADAVSIPTHADQVPNSPVAITVVYDPAGPTVELRYVFADKPPLTATKLLSKAINWKAISLTIGGIAPALSVKAMVLKEGLPGAGDLTAFIEDSDEYVTKSAFSTYDTHTTDSALLRQHPHFTNAENLAGILGGPGDRYASLAWTPIPRDYALKKGFLHVPPTQAKFWKFEFTGLVVEPYESFVPVRRTVKLFRAETVARFQQTGGFGSWDSSADPAVKTMLSLADFATYSDAVNALRVVGANDDHSPTEVLYARDPEQQARARELGWVWGYQPWHTGSTAPSFTDAGRHVYDEVQIEHRTKMAYFVGLKELLAYRVNYTADDDTERYLDHFDDDTNVAVSSAAAFDAGRVFSLGNYAEVISKTFRSRRPITALQFATQQSEAQSLLPDDGFIDPYIYANWEAFGDATLELDPFNHQVTVNRGWVERPYSAFETEPTWGTYSDLEAKRYGTLEGGAPTGLASGGIESARFTPSRAGRIYAATRITAPETLNGPIELQLVSVTTGDVLATTSHELTQGQSIEVWTGFNVGSVSTPLTYGDIEVGGETYGSMEGDTYGDFESLPIGGQVFVRVVQIGATTDTFIVHRISAFDSPISWEFSVDGGVHWYDALDIRNNPDGVLTFPPGDVATGQVQATFNTANTTSVNSIGAGWTYPYEAGQGSGGWKITGFKATPSTTGTHIALRSTGTGTVTFSTRVTGYIESGTTGSAGLLSRFGYDKTSNTLVHYSLRRKPDHSVVLIRCGPDPADPSVIIETTLGTWTAIQWQAGVLGSTANLMPNPVSATNTTAWDRTAGTGGTAAIARQTGQAGWAGAVTTSSRVTWTVATSAVSGGIFFGAAAADTLPIVATDIGAAYVQVRCSKIQRVQPVVTFYNAANGVISSASGTAVQLAANTVTDLAVPNVVAPAATTHAVVTVYAVAGTGAANWANTDWLEATNAHFEKIDTLTLKVEDVGASVKFTPSVGGVTMAPVTDTSPLENTGEIGMISEGAVPSGFSFDDFTYQVADPESGPNTQLRWRLRMYRPNIGVSALAIRPWYDGDGGTSSNHALTVLGPNRSAMDTYPNIHDDPMWKGWAEPIPRGWRHPIIETRQQGRLPLVGVGSERLNTVTDVAVGVQTFHVFNDDFARAELLAGAPLDYETYGPGVWGIVGGQLTVGNLSPTVPSFLIAETSRVRATIGVQFYASTTDSQGLVFRFTDVDNYWTVRPDGLYKTQGGVTNRLGWARLAGNHRFEVTLVGNAIVVTQDAVEVASIIDSFNATSTKYGMWRIA